MSIKKLQRKYKKRNILNGNVNIKTISIVICIIFFVGTICGVIYFNNVLQSQVLDDENNIFILNSVESFKEKEEIFNQSIFQNLLILSAFWILGLSILGMPLLGFIVLFEGFSIGVTISYILINFGFYEGYTYIFLCMYITTILNMIAILLLSGSAYKVVANIFENTQSLKREILRHSATCFLALMFLIFSSFVETFLAEIGKKLLIFS